jgi:hypothetical protein
MDSTHPNNVDKLLKLPSGKTVKVIQINDFLVVGVSEWVAVASDVLKHPGKVREAHERRSYRLLELEGFCSEGAM